jgi:hypothetical protein
MYVSVSVCECMCVCLYYIDNVVASGVPVVDTFVADAVYGNRVVIRDSDCVCVCVCVCACVTVSVSVSVPVSVSVSLSVSGSVPGSVPVQVFPACACDCAGVSSPLPYPAAQITSVCCPPSPVVRSLRTLSPCVRACAVLSLSICVCACAYM